MSQGISSEQAAQEAELRRLMRGATDRPLHTEGDVPVHKIPLAIRVIRESGVLEKLVKWRAEDRARENRGAGGRPPLISDETLLVLFMILALGGQPLHITQATEVLRSRLDPTARDLLGLTDSALAPEGMYDRVRNALHRILDVIDPYPITPDLGGDRRTTLSREGFAAVEAARDPLVTWQKHERLDEFSNSFLDSVFMLLPRHVRRRWDGNIAIDATLVPASGKRGFTKHSTRHAYEPDAGWWRRGGDHRGDSESTSILKLHWGWDLHVGVMVANTNGERDFPLLPLGMKLIKPGYAVGPSGVDILKHIVDSGHPVGYFIGDGVYFPNPDPEHFQLPARALGYKIVGKMPVTERGARFFGKDKKNSDEPDASGALMVEGSWYSPGMPKRLINATIEWEAGLITDDAYRIRIQERGKYLLQRKSRPDRDGYARWRCPASGPRPTVVCPLKGLRPPAGQAVIEDADLPRVPDLICTQDTITIPPTVGAKYFQDLQFQSPEWQRVYGLRNTTESLNGMIKDGGGELLDKPSRRRVKGFTAQQFFCLLALLSLSLRKIDAYLHPTDSKGFDVDRDGPRRRQRRGVSLADHRPGRPRTADPPPAA